MFEITINNNIYPLNFGFGFIREIDPKITRKIDGVNGRVEQLGLQMAVAGIKEGSIEDLLDVIFTANKNADGERISKKDIEAHLENPETDLESLFDTVIDFLSRANCTKNTVKRVNELIEEEKAKQAAQNEQK